MPLHTSPQFRFNRAACATALVCSAPWAWAATASGPMAVTATVTATCKVGASALAFGAVTSAAIAAGNIDAVGNASVNCTAGSNYTVSLDAGTGAGATLASHKMSAPEGSLLSYAIYTTAAKSTLWGDGTSGTVMVAGTGNGGAQSIPAYGRIFAGQIATAASFADIVNVTVHY